MNDKANIIWREMFGKAWNTFVEADPHVGAFLLLHDTKEAMIDKSAMRLMGFISDHNYNELKNALSMVEEYSYGRSPIILKYIDTGDVNVTAGIALLDTSKTELEIDNFLLYSQAQLVQAANNGSGDSLIMLISLDGIDTEHADIDFCIISALGEINACLPEGAMIAGHSKSEYWIYIPDFKGDPLKEAARLQKAVENCKLTDSLGTLISERHNMTFSAGICCGNTAAMYLMHGASFALYEASASGKGRLELFSREQYMDQKSEYNELSRFSRLLDKDLFSYHFQPIVSAQTGDIVAYEALMRTDQSIGFNPLQVLELAKRYDRLYDIELATMNNACKALSGNQSFFENRKLFINSIPSHTLNLDDFTKLKAQYGELLEKTVIEFTEQTEVGNEKFERIRDLMRSHSIQLAIDDYGTGYSNTSNLVRYAPDYVKIDRTLIEDIDRDPKMQALVKGLIEFIHSNGWSALAEGVETAEEVRTAIELGADLLQGYWVSRPKPVFVNEISESIRSEIVNMNLKALGNVQKTYKAEDGDELDTVKLALEKYTDITVGTGKVTLKGDRATPVRLPITVMENCECELNVHDILLEPELLIPAISVGAGSTLTLNCNGINEIRQSGILVPETAKFILKGQGALSISPEAQDCFGIGCGKDKPAGDIVLEMAGLLNITVNGENCVGIGGGTRANVAIRSGDNHITCTSGNCIGIGSVSGDSEINISDCGLEIKASAAMAVCAGSLRGKAKLRIERSSVSITGSGNSICALGTLGEGSIAEIFINSIQLSTNLKGKTIINIGTSGAVTNCRVRYAKLELYSEGGSVSGIGDKLGAGMVDLLHSEIILNFRTADGFTIGSPNGTLSVDDVSRDFRLNE